MSFCRVTLLFAFVAVLFSVRASDHTTPATPGFPGVTRLKDPEGIHNLFALGTNLFSGSSPDNEQGFAALAKLGVRTIISVDGSRPHVALAKKFGMTYVHLPHGYDGINTNVEHLLAKAGQRLPGPIYVHCHHGKHRGPAAAAIICMANNGWTSLQAESWLHSAGTATNYAGLYKSVRNFKPPSAEVLKSIPDNFPETASVSGLIDLMVSIDQQWEQLKAAREAGYCAPADHPDLQPANESVMLWEAYREAQRLPEAKQHGADFIARLRSAENEVKQAETILRSHIISPTSDIRARLDKSFDAIAKSCSSCHKAYRDGIR